jgi:hypothetical protein
MTGDRPAPDLAQRRVFGAADILGEGAAGVEATSRRDIHRAGHLARQDRALAPTLMRVGARHG